MVQSQSSEISLRFWGVRGSFPSASNDHQLLGGHTACVSLQHDGEWLVIDAGSGLRDFTDHYLQHNCSGRVTILVSHCHWDHILGFPYLSERLGPEHDLTVVSFKRDQVRVEDSLRWQQQPGRSNCDWHEIVAPVQFAELEEGELFRVGAYQVTTYQLNHPGVSSGFRIEVAGRTLAYVSDLAPVREALLADFNGQQLSESEFREHLWQNEHRLTHKADAVIYDTFFAEGDWRARVHWGHSAASHAIANCRQSEAARLFLFHHSGEYTDLDQQRLLHQLHVEHPELRIELAQQYGQYSL